jgi:nicotinic acid mononucleotide adenylyltransferase
MQQMRARADVKPFADKIHLMPLDDFHANLSSTQVRQRIAAGEPFERLVPSKVAEFIREMELYQ